MVLGYGFINDCSCCPVTSGCCCPDVNAGTFNLTYTIGSGEQLPLSIILFVLNIVQPSESEPLIKHSFYNRLC